MTNPGKEVPDKRSLGLAEDMVRILFEQVNERPRKKQEGRLTFHVDFEPNGQVKKIIVLPGYEIK